MTNISSTLELLGLKNEWDDSLGHRKFPVNQYFDKNSTVKICVDKDTLSAFSIDEFDEKLQLKLNFVPNSDFLVYVIKNTFMNI